MADIITRKAKGARNRQTPRIDLTPMVDLGFLLITFFMYTTTLASPKVMDLVMPDDKEKSNANTAYPEESTVTVIPTGDHKIVWYTGNPMHPQSIARCGFEGKDNLRDRLAQSKRSAVALPGNYSKEAHLLHVLIKPDPTSTYQDLVNVLDEISINEVQRYAIVNPEAEDIALVKSYGK